MFSASLNDVILSPAKGGTKDLVLNVHIHLILRRLTKGEAPQDDIIKGEDHTHYVIRPLNFYMVRRFPVPSLRSG